VHSLDAGGWIGAAPGQGGLREDVREVKTRLTNLETSVSAIRRDSADMYADAVGQHSRYDRLLERISDKARRTPRRNLPRRIHRSNHAHGKRAPYEIPGFGEGTSPSRRRRTFERWSFGPASS
jgi:hypothetical protein